MTVQLDGAGVNTAADKGNMKYEDEEAKIPLETVAEYTAPNSLETTERPPPTGASATRRRKQFAVSTRWEREVAERGGPFDVHRHFCCCARRIGNMFILLEKGDGTPLVIAGPCWPFCLGVTLPLILGISALVCFFILFNDRANVPLWVAFIYLAFLAGVLVSLFAVSCRDPGLMERVTDDEAGEGGWFWNEQVGSFRPPGALYCRECGVLIEGYDHLCPWTGTGIGQGNMFAFKSFVVGLNFLCYFSIGLVAFVLLDGLF